MEDIPQGHTKEDIKARERIIKDFYASWIAEHPTKQVMNVCLEKPINVKSLSTVGLQRSNQDIVQYCISVPQQMPQTKNKAISPQWD